MATALGEAFVRITARLEEFRRGMDEVRRITTNTMHNVATTLSSLRGVGTSISLFVGAPLVFASRAMLMLGDDALDTAKDLKSVFGESQADILRWSRTLGDSIGQSEFTLQRATKSFGSLFRSMGANTDEAAKLSQQAVEVAADLAAWGDTDILTTINAVRQAMIQGGRGLGQFGINLAGLETAGQSLPVMQARLQMMMEQMRKNGSMGEAADSMNNLSGQMRQLRANVSEIATTIGRAFVPAIQQIVKFFNDWITPVIKFVAKLFEFSTVLKIVTGVLVTLGIVIGPLLLITGNLAAAFVAIYAALRVMRFEMDAYTRAVSINTVAVAANAAASRSMVRAQTGAMVTGAGAAIGGAGSIFGGVGRGAARAAGSGILKGLGRVAAKFLGPIGIAITIADVLYTIISLMRTTETQADKTKQAIRGMLTAQDLGIAGGSDIGGVLLRNPGALDAIFQTRGGGAQVASQQTVTAANQTNSILKDIHRTMAGHMMLQW